MCKLLNPDYMIDRMKYQYFDFSSITRKYERETFSDAMSEGKFCGWKNLQPRPLPSFPKFSIGIAATQRLCVNVGRNNVKGAACACLPFSPISLSLFFALMLCLLCRRTLNGKEGDWGKNRLLIAPHENSHSRENMECCCSTFVRAACS